MSYSGLKITAPVSIDDVKHVLGVGHNSVADLCRSSAINKWARFKPVRHSTKTLITITQRYNAWYGFSGNTGIPYVTDASRLMNYMVYSIIQAKEMAGSQTYWIYSKPAGGSNTPYRLSDFVAKPNDATTPPWVGSLAGYNHSASFPVKVTLSGTGIRNNGGVYEINLQSAGGSITWTIQNQGEDLCVQDFFNWTVGQLNPYCKWRPVVQLFYPNGTTPWYNVDRPTASAGGTEITESRSTALTVSLSTAGKVENQLYHACIGIGCTDTSGSMFPSPNEDLFILPYDINSSSYWLSQFYYQLRFVNHFTHNIKVKEVWYWGTTGGVGVWKQATNTGGSQSFVVGSDILTGDIGVVMEIDQTDIDVYFVPENSSLSVSPKFYISYNETIDPNESKYFYPQDVNSQGVWGTPNPNRILISADPSYSSRTTPLKQTVRAKLTNGIRGSVTSFTYHMKTQVDTAGWVDVNTFSIRIGS